MVARVVYTVSGFERMPPTVSTRKGIDVTWSRCECVTKIWSICDSSASVRSPTPVPASIRMSLSRRNEVVRRWRPPIPPEHPSTRRRIAALFLVEHCDAVPVGRRRVATLFVDFLEIDAVQGTGRVHGEQAPQAHVCGLPVTRAIGMQDGLPFPQLGIPCFRSQRLIDGDGLVLPLDLDAVDFPEYHILDPAARGLPDQDSHAVGFCPTLQPRGDVYGVPHRSIGTTHLRAHVADADCAGIHANADLQRRPAACGEARVERRTLTLHRQRR